MTEPEIPYTPITEFDAEVTEDTKQRHRTIKNHLKQMFGYDDISGFVILVVHGGCETRIVTGGDHPKDFLITLDAIINLGLRMQTDLDRLNHR